MGSVAFEYFPERPAVVYSDTPPAGQASNAGRAGDVFDYRHYA